MRNNIKSGLLKPDSVLGYTAMVGNKVREIFLLTPVAAGILMKAPLAFVS